MFRDLLINVTNFFRDNEAFESLASIVVPRLFEGRGADDAVRVWIPGCSTGEEVFSIGILIREYMDQLTAVPRVQIFATDIDERALVVARAARYPAALLDKVSAERRKRFFIPDGSSFVISKDVRELCIFSPHSVIRDPPFSRIDLVSCRNLLIYFGIDVQNQVIPTFFYALRPNGYLFLGSAENVTQFDDLFVPVEKRHRIFRRRSDVVPALRLPMMVSNPRISQIAELTPRPAPMGAIALRQAVDEQVSERFSPPHVLINREGDVVYVSTRTGKYLEVPAGVMTRQLLSMARRDLRLDLRTLFREAVESNKLVRREGVAIEGDNGSMQLLDLVIEPLTANNGAESLYLVLFIDQGPTLSREDVLSRTIANQSSDAAHFERELRETRDRLHSMMEEYETAIEELKSSNEELISLNEEHQSTNEELEASKEELQSVNEELHTVNTELTAKIEALDQANNDLQNLFVSTEIATVFLDRNLVIRSFTPAVAKIFNILPSDRGRPITHLTSHLTLPNLGRDIARVFDDGGPIERRVVNDNSTVHYLVRVAPYRDGEHKTEGVVVTFLDVTTLTVAEVRQSLLIAELQHRTRNLLTVVASIARQTLVGAVNLDEYAERLAALGRVQSLVGSGGDGAIDLSQMIHDELNTIAAGSDGKIRASGPSVRIGADLGQMFGLAVHELATNALKYGALKEGSGRLDVFWNVDETGPHSTLLFDWRESGVAMPATAPRRGFGRELVERALVFSLRAKTEFTFGPDGISCHIEFPLPPLLAG